MAVRAAVHTVDFEGRSDGRSVRTLLAQVAPRHLILVGGSPQVPSLVLSRAFQGARAAGAGAPRHVILVGRSPQTVKLSLAGIRMRAACARMP